ncbi:uncharacterized protein TNCV_4245991 [Trichonephila clavipes]|nr:uncharacterized protein TNCV_4245991 [Trichonephila clavipes]
MVSDGHMTRTTPELEPSAPYFNSTPMGRKSGLEPLESCPPSVIRGIYYATENVDEDALFICYEQSSDNAHSIAFSQRSSSPCLIEDETCHDSDIISNLINYQDGQGEPDSLRADKNMQGSSFLTNWKSIFLK